MSLPQGERLTRLLGIEHPIMLAGMGGVSYGRLAGAVSAAGGIGTLGGSTMIDDDLAREIAVIKETTERPFGIDLLTAMPEDTMRKLDVVIESGAKLFVAGLGVPAAAVEKCHNAGIVVANMCGKVSHARRAVDSGCDLVIAQGTEAGGHTGRVATLPLVPQIVDAVGDEVPVVAAGGIFDGRGIAAAFALGASGAWIGTRFIATIEARCHDEYKQALVDTAEDGTTITRAFTGKTLRAIANDYTAYFDDHPEELLPFPMQAQRSWQDDAFHLGFGRHDDPIDITKECMPAGQGTGAIDDIVPAGELVAALVAQAEQALANLAETPVTGGV